MNVYKLVFSPIEENTYVIADVSGTCAIIDCGCYDRQEFGQLVNFIEDKKLKPVLLLNTHCHLDHIFGNGFILQKYGLRTHSHKSEESNRKDAPMHSQLFGLRMNEAPDPEQFIEDNQVVTFGTTSFIALHVPGHTSGSLAFYSEKESCVFTGDALFAGSIGRTDLNGGDYNTLITSIRTRLLVLPPSTIVYPGHGDKTTIGDEANANPFLT